MIMESKLLILRMLDFALDMHNEKQCNQIFQLFCKEQRVVQGARGVMSSFHVDVKHEGVCVSVLKLFFRLHLLDNTDHLWLRQRHDPGQLGMTIWSS